MSDTLRHIAQSLKAGLKAPLPANLSEVVAFADEYALNRERYFSLILLNRQFVKAQSEEESQNYLAEVIKVVDLIVAEYESAGEDVKNKAARKQKAAEKGLEEYPSFSSTEIILETTNLEKQYGKTGFRLHDINVKLGAGEILGVVGKNANGKTTLFELLAGEKKATSGQITFPGISTATKPKDFWSEVLAQVAYVPQELSKWYGSLRTNLQFEAAMRGVRGEENELRTEYIIQRLDLDEHLDKSWHELSGGYKLRFALARALVWQPRLLLLDEPLANLDVNAQQLIINDIRTLAKSLRHPISVVISSQHLYEVEAISDTILFLEEGAPLFYGPAQGIGEGKERQVFELQVTGASLAELRKKIAHLSDLTIRQAGVFYLIECSATIKKQEVLNSLTSAEINIEYFRDISNSVKRLFTQIE